MSLGGWCRCAAVLIALGLSAGVAHAQEEGEAPSGRDAEARAVFEAGELAYADGRFADAEEYFRRAHELSQRHALLYNIALSAEQARHDQAALEAYQEFVERVPDSPRAVRARTRIAALQEILANDSGDAGDSGDSGDHPPNPEPEPAPTAEAPVAPWVVLGISAAVAVAGGVLVGLAISDQMWVEQSPRGARWADVVDTYERTEPMSIAGFVLLGVGVAGVLGAVIWAVAGDGGDDASAQLRLGPGSLELRGAF